MPLANCNILFLFFAAVLSSPASSEPLTAGARVLSYLHSRDALHLRTPAPIIATYIDWREVNWSHPEQTLLKALSAGFNVIILAFQLQTGPTDFLEAWLSADPAVRNATLSAAHAKGAVVMLSAGGASEEPYKADPAAYGRAVGEMVITAGLDGVDFDLENLAPGFNFGGVDIVAWMINATLAARAVVGPQRIITHAPQAPYFGAWSGPRGGYLAVYANGSTTIDWFNIQFYNQGPSCYSTYQSTFVAAGSAAGCGIPGTSIGEIAAAGVPLGAIVLGKPLLSADAGTGFTPAAELATWLQQAKGMGWETGVFCWSWEEVAGPAWVQTLYPA